MAVVGLIPCGQDRAALFDPNLKFRKLQQFPCFHSNQLLLQEYTEMFLSKAGSGPAVRHRTEKEEGCEAEGTDPAPRS